MLTVRGGTPDTGATTLMLGSGFRERRDLNERKVEVPSALILARSGVSDVVGVGYFVGRHVAIDMISSNFGAGSTGVLPDGEFDNCFSSCCSWPSIPIWERCRRIASSAGLLDVAERPPSENG